MNNSVLIAPIKQHTDNPHLLIHGAQSTVNSVRCHQARSKMGDQSREDETSYSGGWALRSGSFSGGMIGVRAVKQESLEC
jgi:hypothetical protein